MIFILAFLFVHLSRQVYLTYRDAPALGAGNQSDNAGLMRYQAGMVRAGPIGTLDKHDNKESLEVRLRWRVESAMTKSIVDAIYIYIYTSNRERAARAAHLIGPESTILGSRRQSASTSASN